MDVSPSFFHIAIVKKEKSANKWTTEKKILSLFLCEFLVKKVLSSDSLIGFKNAPNSIFLTFCDLPL